MHARKQIRDAIVAAVSNLPTPNNVVTVGRVYEEHLPDLPALNVAWVRDTIDSMTAGGVGNQHVTHELLVAVEARSALPGDTGAIDDELDQMAAEVQAAIAADPKLGGLAQWTELIESEIDRSGEAQKPIGELTMAYRVQYRVDSQDPETIIP